MLKLLLLESVTNGDGMASFLRGGEYAKYAASSRYHKMNYDPFPARTHKVYALYMQLHFHQNIEVGNKSIILHCKMKALESNSNSVPLLFSIVKYVNTFHNVHKWVQNQYSF